MIWLDCDGTRSDSSASARGAAGARTEGSRHVHPNDADLLILGTQEVRRLQALANQELEAFAEGTRTDDEEHAAVPVPVADAASAVAQRPGGSGQHDTDTADDHTITSSHIL
jgi:hypothetical protein